MLTSPLHSENRLSEHPAWKYKIVAQYLPVPVNVVLMVPGLSTEPVVTIFSSGRCWCRESAGVQGAQHPRPCPKAQLWKQMNVALKIDLVAVRSTASAMLSKVCRVAM